MVKKTVFAWDDEPESLSTPEGESSYFLEHVKSFHKAVEATDEEIKLREEYEKGQIHNTITNLTISKKDVSQVSRYVEEYKKSSHLVLLVHALYKDAADDLDTEINKVDAVYTWYISKVRHELVENDNAMKLMFDQLGKFQISLKCILGTLYRRMLYSEKMLDLLAQRRFRDPLYQRKAMFRAIFPTNLVYHKGIARYEILKTFPEFQNKVVDKTYELFQKIGKRIPQLHEHIQRILSTGKGGGEKSSADF